ncbi:hypothetical protein [Bacillus salacetis]|nr:hypothetical protein [Bacillus salacetis]
MELDNAASIRLVYWEKFKLFHFGAHGTDRISDIIQEEKSRAAPEE